MRAGRQSVAVQAHLRTQAAGEAAHAAGRSHNYMPYKWVVVK